LANSNLEMESLTYRYMFIRGQRYRKHPIPRGFMGEPVAVTRHHRATWAGITGTTSFPTSIRSEEIHQRTVGLREWIAISASGSDGGAPVNPVKSALG
jgi:hypothetical protein